MGRTPLVQLARRQEEAMGPFSVFTIAAGMLSLFGSALSLGLTFLDTVKGDSWAPTRTGQFIAHYIGVDLGLGRLIEWIGFGSLLDGIMYEPLYKVLFGLGLALIFISMTARGVSQRT